MKKIFSFTKKKKHPSGTPDNGSVLSVGYELKDKDLGKVHKAASVGDLAKLKQLAKKNDINQLDKENRTALHIACASGHGEVVQFLVESKAKLNLCDNQNRSALMKAVQGQHEHCVNILLENHAEPNLVDINGNTALHLASNIPSISTAVLLLQHGAEINAQNKEGFTPLTVAVREDHIEMAEFLLKESADVNFMDQDRRSPLMIAAGNGQINMVRLLLQFDADITLKDTKGWSADDYAGMNGHHPCSLLISEHGTQRNDGTSLSLQGPSNKKKKMLGSPSQDVEAGFSLGGPATDKDDFEDNSQSESLSRVSKSAADEWPSSEDDDESVSVDKKVNLSKMIVSTKGKASVLRDTSLSGTESEPENENSIQRIPSLPKASSSTKTPQLPVDPSPVSFLSKAPQMTSTPLSNYRKKEDSTEDDDDDDKEAEQDEEEEEDISDEDGQPEESGESVDAASTIPEAQVSKDNKRDFRSELGLEKGEDEQDSWDSESHSEHSNVPHEEKQNLQTQEAMSTAEEEVKENLFYTPSFLRGERGNRMAVLEPWRGVGWPGGRQGEVGNSSNDDNRGEEDGVKRKENEKAKWEPLSVLSKLEGDANRQKDLMEELGLGDVDDLEDASDWDSASTTSKRTLPGRRMTSPGLEESPEISNSPVKEQDEDVAPTAPLTPQRSISSDKKLPSTPSRLVPHPQPRVRKMVLQKPESEEESDWEPDKVTSPCNEAQPDNELQNIAALPEMPKPGSPELSQMAKESESDIEIDEQQQQEKDDAVGRYESDLNKSARVGSDSGEQDEEFRDQCSPEERGNASDDAPWERRYEKIWVEVEKREVKSTFKNVAGELKEKFGELFKSRHPAENVTEEEGTSAEEESSDEEEGEIIVRPMARARSTVLLTIPEQRESGLEDSAAESTDNSVCEDRMQRCVQPASDGSIHQEPDLLTDDPLEVPSPQLTTEQRESTDSMIHAARVFTDGHTIPMYAGDHSSVLRNDTKQHMDPALKDTTADLSEAEDDLEEFNVPEPPSLRRCSASVPGVSDEELEEDMERFKFEVGMLTVVFLSLEKEKAQLQKEVEDGRPSHSHF